jgi:DNA ligase (NAD+)
MADKSAQNVMDSIEKAKTPTLARLIYALGIDHVGQRTAELLAERFGTLEALQRAPEEEIASVYEVGKVAGKSVRTWLDHPFNQNVLRKLREAGVHPVVAAYSVTADSQFAGKSFVFTGTLSMSRREAEEMVKRLGGRIAGSVSKKTDYVVVGQDAGSKADRARELGVTIVSENEFKALIGEKSGE